MKGIILAGGFGTRLQPMTKVTNKHLLPVYDKPMIYYPIKTLVSGGVTDIMILTGSDHAGDFMNLLGDGSEFGANFTYRPQRGAGGIAHALGLCRVFVRDEPMVVILGDNIFGEDPMINQTIREFDSNSSKACIFLKIVPDPERFGVATIDNGEITRIVEKPKQPDSDLAVTGLYFYNSLVWEIIDNLTPSDRNELEITSVNNWYLDHGLLNFKTLNCFWSDAGTPESLYHSATFAKNELSTP